MKNINLLLLACALCIGQFCYSQEPTYTWGDPCTNDNLERKIDRLLELDDNGFIILRSYTNSTFTTSYWIEYYDGNLNLEGNNEVLFNLGVMGDSYNIEGIEVAGGIVYVFVTHWIKSEEKHTLMLYTLSLDGEMTFVNDLSEINAQKMGNKGFFQTSISDDGSKLLVLSEQKFIKKTNEKLQFTCYELPSLKQLYSFDKELNAPSKKANNNHIAVDDNGRGFMFKKLWVKPSWSYYHYQFSGSEVWTKSTFNVNEGEIIGFHLGFDIDNQHFLYYLYTNKPSAYNRDIHGYTYVHFNSDLKEDVFLNEKWDFDLVAYFGGEKLANNAEKSKLEDFYIKDVLNRDDGKLLLLLEQKKSKSSAIAGSSPMQFSYEWEYDDFLVLCMEPKNGNLEWWSTFQKHQEMKTSEDYEEYGSVVYHLKDDRLFVLYNNTDLSIPSIPAANWTEPDGTKYVKHKAFNDKTMHGSFMYVFEPNGDIGYGDRTYGLPLLNLHDGAVFEMSLTTPFFFDLNGKLVIMSSMHNGGKRYRFGFVGL